ncbi:hypothetical protein [Aquimarina macrocephali]|uniref:hypothetical protein n=1 Tax=Aquimarina macrocephali TaxID=666563 RepID=UPI00046396C1|nr:hypothetical protein [Aquimarina macrocephali]
MKKVLVVLSFILLCVACNTSTKKENKYEEDIEVRDPKPVVDNNQKKIPTTAEAIANANGLQHWDKVKEIKFTFNVDRDSTHYDRSWSWKPKNDMVTLTSEQDTITYNRTQLDSISIKADQRFINDKYWLLAPFNLVWDTASFTSKHEVKAIAPISNIEMQKLTIVYKNNGGYTPGDAYDFYFEGDFSIKEWVFRKSNQSEPSMITSWEDYQNFNGIKIAKTHKLREGNRKLYFTGIEVITE